MRQAVSIPGLLEAGANLGLTTLYATFAFLHTRAFLAAPRVSLLAIVAFEAAWAAMFLARRSALAVSRDPVSWAAMLAGTFGPLLFRPVPGAHDVPLAQAVQLSAMAFAFYGLASLNRSIGLLPANRGIRSAGAYRVVRHPLYAAYAIANAGYVVSNWSVVNAAVWVVAVAAQLVRIRQEEILLLRDPDYQAYARSTRWRLLPFVY
ncbi:isoprenylcysteine carboxyl methyltransferase [Anaeromyxobacter dehalogenans 2CP-1]|uniref:Isoprenylcysteine carboxyl methyltransferase n=1 Tax=Anaeromyxobacter dehalogenans (strain ATCC BAA-258 / DSM 21875 / 2CP-1) TaxID=455488 RepID=B8JFH3_ANAD2|nr:isoprenylcysteine carboxylmethyltransferase family protein [Anaeromyxobacter dehalogenans]ACL66350.1 isoprenylcysteine carboxyl methyltransferase [Anaeromyxobacter dehalogenans 2CP-1]